MTLTGYALVILQGAQESNWIVDLRVSNRFFNLAVQIIHLLDHRMSWLTVFMGDAGFIQPQVPGVDYLQAAKTPV